VAVIAVIIHYAHLSIPHVHSGFVILLIGYFVLLAGNSFRGPKPTPCRSTSSACSGRNFIPRIA
jgi:hypothetical protein